MVEPPKGIGPLQGLISGSKVSEPTPKRINEPKDSSPQDEVKLSPEAISLSQAENSSAEVRDSLAKYTEVTLSSGQNFDESL